MKVKFILGTLDHIVNVVKFNDIKQNAVQFASISTLRKCKL